MSEQDTWDVIVVGGGPAGENAADYAIRGSDRTAVIVEAELVGGECSYWACMPSKALLRPVEALESARHLPGVASRVSSRGIDVRALLARRDDFTSHLDDSSQVRWARGAGIDVVRGRGRLAGARAVEVQADGGATRVLRARHAVVLATGTTASVPDNPGLREALPWTSRDVTNLHEVPRRVAIIGGGVVACEAATWLLALGVEELTLVNVGGSLLARVEPFAGAMVQASLEEHGATVLASTSVDRVRRAAPRPTGVGHVHGGEVTLHLGRRRVVVDEVVAATGRTPSSDGLGLGSVGLAERVRSAKGYLPTNDRLQVEGVRGGWLYAVGDLNGRSLLTHMGKYQARAAGAVIAALAEGKRPIGRRLRDLADHGMVPQVTFTDPQVASVGLTESAARDAGHEVETLTCELSSVAGAVLHQDGYTGRAMLVVDRRRSTLLGATFVGPGVAEIVHAATVAIVGGVTLDQLWHAVPSYPTMSEVWLRLLESRTT